MRRQLKILASAAHDGSQKIKDQGYQFHAGKTRLPVVNNSTGDHALSATLVLVLRAALKLTENPVALKLAAVFGFSAGTYKPIGLIKEAPKIRLIDSF